MPQLDSHNLALYNAVTLQVAGDLIGALVELPVCKIFAIAYNGNRIGRSRGLLRKTLVDSYRGYDQNACIPGEEKLVAFFIGE